MMLAFFFWDTVLQFKKQIENIGNKVLRMRSQLMDIR